MLQRRYSACGSYIRIRPKAVDLALPDGSTVTVLLVEAALTAQGAFDGFEHDGWNKARVGGGSSHLVCHTRSRDLTVLN